MHVRPGLLHWRRGFTHHQPNRKDISMVSHVKNALITTGIVLATIWVLRKVPVASGVVNQAING